MEHRQLSLKEAIVDILDGGVKAIDLSHQLGFQDSAMVYRYRTGKAKSCSAIRAQIILQEYDILLDDYVSTVQLKTKVDDELLAGAKIKDGCQHLMDKLIIIASYKGADLRSRLLKFIAEHAGE